MKRWITHSASAGILAACAFIFWPASDSPGARDHDPAGVKAGMAPLPWDGEGRLFRTRCAGVSSGLDRFMQRSREIAAMSRTTEREDAIRSLAREWAAEDPLAAERWAAAFREPADFEHALTHVCLQIGGRDPLRAIGIARMQELGEDMVEVIVGRWAEFDFAAAAQWVGELPEGEARDGLLAKLALSRAEAAPAEAASMVAISLVTGSRQEEAAISVLHQWLLQDPEAAEQWIDAFPEGPLKERARHEIEGITAYLNERQAER